MLTSLCMSLDTCRGYLMKTKLLNLKILILYVYELEISQFAKLMLNYPKLE